MLGNVWSNGILSTSGWFQWNFNVDRWIVSRLFIIYSRVDPIYKNIESTNKNCEETLPLLLVMEL